MTLEERLAAAAGYRGEGYNCCQAVLCACGDLTGLEAAQGVSLAYGFGSGMQCGEACGAMTGGMMAIGACVPGDAPQAGRPVAAAAVREFQKMFKERFGTLLCREIIAKNGRRMCEDCVACGVRSASAVIEKLREGAYQR